MKKKIQCFFLFVLLITSDGKLLKNSECVIAENKEPDKYDSVYVCNEMYEEPFTFIDVGVSGIITHVEKTIYRINLNKDKK